MLRSASRMAPRSFARPVFLAALTSFGGWRLVVTLRDRPRPARRRLTSHERRVAGARIHHRAAPGRLPHATSIVLVHGLGVSGRYLEPLARRMPDEHAVYVPDLPGHGASDRPAEPLDVPQLADRLVAWMDAVGLARVVLLGHSMGCQVALAAAERHPERVARLVLAGPSVDARARDVPRQLLRLLADVPFERPSLVPIVIRDYLRRGTRIVPELRAMLRDAPERRAACVRCPVLIVRGALDPVVPRAWARMLADALADARVVEIRDWGHAVHHGAPHAFVAAVAPFLSEERAPTTTHRARA